MSLISSQENAESAVWASLVSLVRILFLVYKLTIFSHSECSWANNDCFWRKTRIHLVQFIFWCRWRSGNFPWPKFDRVIIHGMIYHKFKVWTLELRSLNFLLNVLKLQCFRLVNHSYGNIFRFWSDRFLSE